MSLKVVQQGHLEHAQRRLAVISERTVKYCKAAKVETTLDLFPRQSPYLSGAQLLIQLLPSQRNDPALWGRLQLSMHLPRLRLERTQETSPAMYPDTHACAHAQCHETVTQHVSVMHV